MGSTHHTSVVAPPHQKSSVAKMKLQVAVMLFGMVAAALARPAQEIIDYENGDHEHEQEGVPGTSVTGEYTWTNAAGETYDIKYIADHLGYRVVESDDAFVEDNLPASVADDGDFLDEEPSVRSAAPVEEEAEAEEEEEEVEEEEEEEDDDDK